jgi:antitoxin (DNA-binding transcriptional repressor) of toxin-antitoxin stability system
MKIVRVGEAKNNLSRHLAYVRRGGRVRIMDRNVPVADLVPVEPAPEDGTGDAAEIASLERRGVARRGKSGSLPSDLLKPGPGKRARVLEALLEERRSSR